MRRTLAVLALSGLVAVVAGSAALTGVDAGALQYGTDSVSCDSDGVDVHWGLENNDGKVYFVRVADIASDCDGADVFVTVVDSAGASLFEGHATAGAGTVPNQVRISIPGQISAELVEGVKIGIEGGAGDAVS